MTSPCARTPRGTRLRASVILLLAFCGGLEACDRVTETATPTASEKIPVTVTRVRRGSIADERSVSGKTAALSTIRVASPVAGRVTALTALPGDSFDAGAVVARVIPLQNEAGLDGLRILNQAETPSAHEQALNARMRSQLKQGDVALRAPFSAIVSARLRNPGEHVAPSDILLELFAPQSLYVLAQIPLAWAAEVRAGTEAEIRTATARVPGRVAAILPIVQNGSLTVPARIEITTPLAMPLLDAVVECRLMIDRHDAALLIPLASLVSSHTADRGIVMVAEDGLLHSREIQLGLRDARDIEVTAALAEGDLVAVDGQYGLPDGTAIEPTLADE